MTQGRKGATAHCGQGASNHSAWLEHPIQGRARMWLEMMLAARRGATLLRPDGLAKECESLGHRETLGHSECWKERILSVPQRDCSRDFDEEFEGIKWGAQQKAAADALVTDFKTWIRMWWERRGVRAREDLSKHDGCTSVVNYTKGKNEEEGQMPPALPWDGH